MAWHEICKIMTATRTIRQSCHVSAKAKLCAVSSLHVDLGLPVFVLFGTLLLFITTVCQKAVVPTRFICNSSGVRFGDLDFLFPTLVQELLLVQ